MIKPLLAALGLALLSAGAQAAPEDIVKKSGCLMCHQVDKKVVGPSYKEIAAKYKGKKVEAQLFDKVRKGGGGVWGPVPMIPHTPQQISDADLKTVIAWVLKQ
ncbi:MULTISPECIES: c-type cytochrome [unclassified Rubrivivax]|uniref:c-type cytochrome n=1 Tax=unclassified Rubrivivax TaxID=2649762 RepID=UPI0013E98D21|nr:MULTISPECIES: c-type cytochrome [unclassified Rubrivivax]MCC9598479.1 c-type cytochrome [Rubrivivax sp. JA1055]MCC9648179.1 c-type cytochrome [Rubrivivax sp. JA1029]MCD0422912.1 c-type cytochrome [Rubrivivax sp. JA1024]